MEIRVELQEELVEALARLSDGTPFLASPVAVGLLAAIAAIGATAIERWQASRLQERQSEIDKRMKVHSLQLQALSVLSEVAHEVTPTDEPVQGADSHEWLSPIVYSLDSIVSTLDKYLRDYAYVTPSEVVPLVRDAISIANTHKWGVIEADDSEYEPSGPEIDGVVKLGNTLEKAVEKFKKNLGI